MDTINSRAQFGAAGGAGLDPVKINQIFEKIGKWSLGSEILILSDLIVFW